MLDQSVHIETGVTEKLRESLWAIFEKVDFVFIDALSIMETYCSPPIHRLDVMIVFIPQPSYSPSRWSQRAPPRSLRSIRVTDNRSSRHLYFEETLHHQASAPCLGWLLTWTESSASEFVQSKLRVMCDGNSLHITRWWVITWSQVLPMNFMRGQIPFIVDRPLLPTMKWRWGTSSRFADQK
jgi:hypothetical protein